MSAPGPECLAPTPYLDSDEPSVVAFAEQATASACTDVERAVGLFYAVRDGIRYNPYGADPTQPENLRASTVLTRGESFCIPKAVLLAAAARAVGIPSRLRFADVRNHLTTPRLREKMGTDLFVYHGYVELFVEDRWVKATPTFNRSLCERFGVKPLEFDGRQDCLLHAFDAEGRQHMEYVHDRGVETDLPIDKIEAVWRAHYPGLLESDLFQDGDFEAEAGEVPGSSA